MFGCKMLIVSIVVVLLMLVDRFEDVDGLKCWVKGTEDDNDRNETKARVKECGDNGDICMFERENGKWTESSCSSREKCEKDHIPITSDCSEMLERTTTVDDYKFERCCCTDDECNKVPFGRSEAWPLIVAALITAIWQL